MSAEMCQRCGDAVTREADELVGSDGEVTCPDGWPHGPAVPDYPECAEGGHILNDDNPGRPICKTCDDDPAIAALYPREDQS